MSEFNLDFLVQATNAKVLSRHQEIFEAIATDTRKSMEGCVFIALKGESFDAHAYLQEASDRGAAALLVHEFPQKYAHLLDKLTIVQVPDTLLALQALAHRHRLRSSALVIGIAGSNGKTTSKEFTATLLSQFRKVHYSKGSFNNHWGVPFTLLAQPEDIEMTVVEMGMNHKDELALLAQIAAPDIAVCTYVGVEHIEHFGSLEKIAEAEQEIYDFSPAEACRIYNLDNAYTKQMFEQSRSKFPNARILTFSENQATDVQMHVTDLNMQQMTVSGIIAGISGQVKVEVFGRHNVTNLMVAASIGLAAGLEAEQIWAGLADCKTTWGRNQLLKTQVGAQILFDGYNSNPDSMKALAGNLELLKVPGRKIGVFAEMRELGELAAQMHEETAESFAAGGLSVIWFYGPHHVEFVSGLKKGNFSGQILNSADFDENLAMKLAESLRSTDIVLVKGSRGMQLERFVKLAKALNFEQKS